MTSNDICRICLGNGYLTNIFENRDSGKISTTVTTLAGVNNRLYDTRLKISDDANYDRAHLRRRNLFTRGLKMPSLYPSEKTHYGCSFHNVVISPCDGLPDKICTVCIKKLDNCTAFINLCQESDTKLRTLPTVNDDEESPTGLEIDFDSENYSLGIVDENFADCNLLTVNDSGDQVSDVTDQFPLGKKSKNFKENKTEKAVKTINDKKKSVKQQCFTCGKVMSSRFRLKTHLRIHTGERPFSCPHCNKNFSLEQNLKVHMRVHTGEKPLQCSDCGAWFAHTAGLAAHRRKHSGHTPYHCKLCPRSFRTNGHLHYHVRRHTGEKNFECDTCNKAFITRSGLKQHLLTHTGDRPHVCAVCGKRMTRASHVKRHMQQTHQTLACNQCSETFQLNADLEKHKLMHGSEKT